MNIAAYLPAWLTSEVCIDRSTWIIQPSLVSKSTLIIGTRAVMMRSSFFTKGIISIAFLISLSLFTACTLSISFAYVKTKSISEFYRHNPVEKLPYKFIVKSVWIFLIDWFNSSSNSSFAFIVLKMIFLLYSSKFHTAFEAGDLLPLYFSISE